MRNRIAEHAIGRSRTGRARRCRAGRRRRLCRRGCIVTRKSVCEPCHRCSSWSTGRSRQRSIRNVEVEDLRGRDVVPPREDLFAKCTPAERS
ncbi:hypothetical protein ACTMU2_37160 [Cupriavidus basilensis]